MNYAEAIECLKRGVRMTCGGRVYQRRHRGIWDVTDEGKVVTEEADEKAREAKHVYMTEELQRAEDWETEAQKAEREAAAEAEQLEAAHAAALADALAESQPAPALDESQPAHDDTTLDKPTATELPE